MPCKQGIVNIIKSVSISITVNQKAAVGNLVLTCSRHASNAWILFWHLNGLVANDNNDVSETSWAYRILLTLFQIRKLSTHPILLNFALLNMSIHQLIVTQSPIALINAISIWNGPSITNVWSNLSEYCHCNYLTIVKTGWPAFIKEVW